MTCQLIWYRSDLRTRDHAPLFCAAAMDQPLIAVYVFDPRDYGNSPHGFPRMGRKRAQFLLEAVGDLRRRLRQLGGDLIVRSGHTEDVIAGCLSEFPVQSIHAHNASGTDEEERLAAVSEIAQQHNASLKLYEGETLYHPDDLPLAVSETPELFSKFRRQVEHASTIREPLDEPNRVSPPPLEIDPGTIPSLQRLFGSLDPSNSEATEDPNDPQFEGGQAAAWHRIEAYIWEADRLRVYKETRNGMLERDDSSKLSPWLAHGCVSPRSIAAEIRRYEDERLANDSTYWLLFELMWRDYFHFILRKHRHRLFRASGLQGIALPWRNDEVSFSAWCEGCTGYPLVDANMVELQRTGFMSNRGRQNVASFLTKNLGIDWRLGAEYFESRLIDHDVASNWGNWNYAAGVGNDARGFRFFHIIKQAKKYDPDGAYVKHWVPSLSPVSECEVHTPWEMSPARQAELGCVLGRDYPAPIVDLIESAEHHERLYRQAIAHGRKR
ncbi:MAG: DASH family cryptochrome [Planctomycetota bacterium]